LVGLFSVSAGLPEMKRPLHFSPGLRGICFAAFVTIFLLAVCGKRQSAAGQTPPKSSGHSVTITWTPSKSAVTGYIVYRVSANGKTDRLTMQVITDTKYTDGTVQAGQTYNYYVTSVDGKGAESKPSEKITATVPSTPPSKH
jgi:hypothetical protein